jgi:glycerol-3-phosphate acyltransferase PlsY
MILIGLSFTAFGFLLGSLPLAVWISRWLARADVRAFGDGNPGATNALRAGGWRVGLLVLMLDVFKGALPVSLAYWVFGLRGPWMAAAALAPSLGHAFSPFLGGRGGKALASMLGAWIGLTLFEVPLISLALLVSMFAILSTDAWSVILAVVGSGAYLLVYHPDSLLIAILCLQAALVVWKHRHGLAHPPALRPALRARLLPGSGAGPQERP